MDREVLFDNERFIIGVVQVVSAGAVIAAIGQFDKLWPFIGDFPFLLFVSLQILALGLAVFAAYAKHVYKVADVKSEKAKANKWLPWMRHAITASVSALLTGLAVFLLAAWIKWII